MMPVLFSSIYTSFKKCFAALFLGLLIFQACVEKRDTKQNIVVAHFPSEPITLHPTNGTDMTYKYVQEYVQKTLTRIDMRTQQQIPLLVKGLAQASADGLQYTYELRDDVKWDDGSPLTVDDIIFTIKVNKCPLTANETQRSTFDNIKDIVKDPANPRKFSMIAKDQYYKNPYLFDEVYLIEKKFWDPKGIFSNIPIWEMDNEKFDAAKYNGLAKWEEDFNKGETGRDTNKINGLGAYKVTNWEVGSSITLTRKNNWWGEKDTSAYNHAYPNKIIFKFFNDDAAIYLGLKKQTLDVVTFISNNSFMKLRANDSFNKQYYSGFTDNFGYNYMGMNMKPDGKKHKPFFTDKRVRKAMAYLTPLDEMIQTIMQGKGIRQASFIQPVNKEYYNDTLKLIPYDPEKAKQLLTEAGWIDTDKDGIRDKVINGKKTPFSFQLTYVTSPTSKESVLMIKNAMYKAGVDMQLNPVDGGMMINSAVNHDFDMVISAWSGSSIPEDPEQIFHTRNWDGGYNFVGFGNAETDKLLDETSRETNTAKRIELLKKLQAIVYDEAPYVFTYSVQRKVAFSKRFENPGMYAERPGVMLNNLKLKD
jgi:peptide/nickel transport system substrate-binding protein